MERKNNDWPVGGNPFNNGTGRLFRADGFYWHKSHHLAHIPLDDSAFIENRRAYIPRADQADLDALSRRFLAQRR